MASISRRLVLASAVLLAGIAGASAQSFPTKPVRLVLPYPPGGSGDAILRPMVPKISEALGQSLVIDSRPGANAVVGTDLVAKSAPDGYTLILGALGPFAVLGAMGPLPFDPVKDFAPVSFLATQPNVLVVHPSLPVNTVAELVAYARANKGTLNYGSSGPGSSNQLAAELFNQTAGLDVVHVAYRGGAPAQLDLLGGRLTLMFDSLPAAIPHIKEGKLKALAVTSRARQPSLPDTPTMIEAGFADFETGSWFGVLAPAGTPRPIVDQISAAIVKVLREPEMRERFIAMGFDVNPGTPQAFADFLKAESTRWHRVVKEAGIKSE